MCAPPAPRASGPGGWSPGTSSATRFWPWCRRFGFTFAALISEAVVTETVFALPGIGRLVVQSILQRDYPVIQGVILVIVVLYLIVNLLVDISYRMLDPRVELQ